MSNNNAQKIAEAKARADAAAAAAIEAEDIRKIQEFLRMNNGFRRRAAPAPPAAPSDEEIKGAFARLETIFNDLGALNGLVHFDIDREDYRFIAGPNRLRIPAGLFADEQPEPHIGRYIDAADMNKLQLANHFSQQGTLWNTNTDDFTQFNNLGLRTTLYVAAVNMPIYGNNPLLSLRAAYFLSIGLVNSGADKYEREWVKWREPPHHNSYAQVLNFAIQSKGGVLEGVMTDLAGFLGYRRMMRVHIYISTDQGDGGRGAKIDRAVVERIVAQAGIVKAELDKVPDEILLYISEHHSSMTGAIGFYHAMRERKRFGPLMEVRDVPVGDNWKSVAISVAGYKSLVFLPLISDALRGYAGEIAEMEGLLRKYADDKKSVRTSTLSNIVVGEDPIPIPVKYNALISFLSAMIAGASMAGYVAKSIGESYYIKRITNEQRALVMLWSDLFSSFVTQMQQQALPRLIGSIASQAGLKKGQRALPEPEEEGAKVEEVKEGD